MFLFGGGKGGAAPQVGARLPPSPPVRILAGYARGDEAARLFEEELAACAPARHLEWEEALEAFPNGLIPAAVFELWGERWRLHARVGPDGRPLHIATPVAPSDGGGGYSGGSGGGGVYGSGGGVAAAPGGALAPAANGRQLKLPQQAAWADEPASASPGASSGGGGGGGHAVVALPPGSHAINGPMATVDDSDSGASGSGRAAGGGGGGSGGPSPRSSPGGSGGGSNAGGGGGGGATARRKYVRDIVVATNPAHDSLGRYKALIALIEHCKARGRALRPGPGTDWGREPARSLLHAIVDVGEALAGFGNAHFPERSGEARAVLAADYKALLSEYLRALGGVLVPGACRGIGPEAEAELRSVGSLLATRCEAYKVLYEQLVAHVGAEGRGSGAGAASAPVLIFNTNSNAVDASPVTHNTNTAEAEAKSRAINAGLSAAAVAVLALSLGLVVRTLRRHAGAGGTPRRRRGEEEDEERRRYAHRFTVPRGRGGREMALVSTLSACGDELRKAARNEGLLRDDWRLGRAVRLSWPPAPDPPGFAPLAEQACDVTGVLQELYGR